MKDKNSKAFWGNAKWHDIHCEAAAANTSEKMRLFKRRMYDLLITLPCDICRDHWREILQKTKIDQYMNDRNSLFLWSYLAHDLVNKSLGKTSPPFSDAKEYYFKGIEADCDDCKL